MIHTYKTKGLHANMRLTAIFLLGVSTLFNPSVVRAAPPELPSPMRGVTVGMPGLTAELFTLLEETEVNVIRVGIASDQNTNNPPTAMDPLKTYETNLAYLDAALPMAEAADIKIILTAANIYGRSLDFFWTDPDDSAGFRDHLADLWGAIATRYLDDPSIVAFDVLNEPNFPAGQSALWYDEMLPQSITAIRNVDTNIWLVVEPGPWGLAGGFSTMQLVNDPHVIYSFHHYAPHSYTHQDIGAYAGYEAVYPGTNKNFLNGPLSYWGKEQLREEMQPAIDFAQTHNVRMYVGEFGVLRWAEGGAAWLEDSISIFEEEGWDWTFHSLATWNGWNATYPSNAPASLVPDGGYRGDRWDVLMNYWNSDSVAPPFPLLLAGWERGNQLAAPTQTLAGFDGSSSWEVSEGTPWATEWDRWDNDTTFGTLIGGAQLSQGAYRLDQGLRTSASLSFSVTNNSLVDYDLSHLSFDIWRPNNASDTYMVSAVGGDISLSNNFAMGNTTGVGGVLPEVGGSDYEDFDISLAVLADRTLAPGESATFQITFTDTTPATSAKFYVDNVAIIGTPSPVALIINIISLKPFSSQVMKLVIHTTDPSVSYLKTKTDLLGTWANVGHSMDGSAPFIETNLSYSTTSGTNVEIYVETTNAPAQFFGVGSQ